MKHTLVVPMYVKFNRVIDALEKVPISNFVFHDGSRLVFTENNSNLNYVAVNDKIVQIEIKLDHYVVEWDGMEEFGEFISKLYTFH